MPSRTTGGRRTPSMRGIEKPQTSASITATLLPRAARETARFVVTDDLPTPPLPEAMSSTRVRLEGSAKGIVRPCAWPWAGWLPAVEAGSPWRFWRSADSSSSVMTVKSRSTPVIPSRAVTASVTRRWISLRSGHPATVRAISTPTVGGSIRTSLTMPRSTMLRWSSGSSTGRRTSMTAASVTVTIGGSSGGLQGRFGITPTPVGRIPAVESRPLSPTDFSSAVSALTSAFGDPTRRGIWLFAHEHDDGVTAAEVAQRFTLHPNVARHHLDKLTAGGYLEVTLGRAPGAGAGRPSKRYRVVADRVDLDVPIRHDDLVITLLGRALALLPREAAEAMAEEVGLEYGRAMARAMGDTSDGQRSFRASLHAVADALTAHGFAAHAEKRGSELRIVSRHCPFGDAAVEHPVICAVDRGMVKGMLAGLYGETEASIQSSLPMGDSVCITAVEA